MAATTPAVPPSVPIRHDQQLLSTFDSDHLTRYAEEFPLESWHHGNFSDINWLEAPTSPALHLSPFSWTFPFGSELADNLVGEASHVFDVSTIQPNNLTADADSSGGRSVSRNHVASSDITSPRGEYYVDGEPARLPRVGRSARPVEEDRSMQMLWNGTFSVHLTDTASIPHDTDNVTITEVNYDIIFDLYDRICRRNDLFGPVFTDHIFPSKPILEALLGVARAKLGSILPFLHWTRFFNNARSYLLDLALIAFGGQYLDEATFGISLHEFTRRCLVCQLENARPSSEESFCTAAATLLNTLGSAYCGYEPLRLHALRSRNVLSVNLEQALGQIDSLAIKAHGDVTAEQWHVWIRRESNIRLAFSIWLVDAMLTTHLQQRPVIRSTDLKTLTLPCNDKLWQCDTFEAWHALCKSQDPPTALEEILQRLYYSKSFSVKHSEFVRIITIHGLYHRLWDVEQTYSNALSFWEPSSAKYAEDAAFPKAPPWLPSVAAFQAWQNASCDALDVLHWQANSTIGQMRGLEHPTVLHLHFARIVLLCPCREITSIAQHLTSPAGDKFKHDDMSRATDLVRRWAVHHQYKARLAAIHAGVSLWHVRRHGIDAFYEPPTLGLAILVLWAFSIFADRKKTIRASRSVPQEATNAGPPSVVVNTFGGDHPSDEPNSDSAGDSQFILLDRPTDDELVQQFIRDGASMSPFMSGVGKVFAVSAPPRILAKGVELLRQQKHWNTSVEWIRLLQQLRSSPPFRSGN